MVASHAFLAEGWTNSWKLSTTLIPKLDSGLGSAFIVDLSNLSTYSPACSLVSQLSQRVKAKHLYVKAFSDIGQFKGCNANKNWLRILQYIPSSSTWSLPQAAILSYCTQLVMRLVVPGGIAQHDPYWIESTRTSEWHSTYQSM